MKIVIASKYFEAFTLRMYVLLISMNTWNSQDTETNGKRNNRIFFCSMVLGPGDVVSMKLVCTTCRRSRGLGPPPSPVSLKPGCSQIKFLYKLENMERIFWIFFLYMVRAHQPQYKLLSSGATAKNNQYVKAM